MCFCVLFEKSQHQTWLNLLAYAGIAEPHAFIASPVFLQILWKIHAKYFGVAEFPFAKEYCLLCGFM